MGFGGGGSNVTKNHTHSSTIVQDGGDLAANVTQFGLTNGSILYSDGSNIQELGIGGAGEALQVSGGVPAWVSGGGAKYMFSCGLSNFTASSTKFFGIGGGTLNGGTEASFISTVTAALTLKFIQITVESNGKASDQTFGISDDGSTIGGVNVVGTGTGQFDSGAVSVSIAAGSDLCFSYGGSVAGTVDAYTAIAELDVA
jgi:hypothetical protein